MHEKTAGCRGVVGCQALRDLPDADLHLHLLCLELGSDVKLHCGAAVAWPVVPLPLFWDHPSNGSAVWHHQLWPLAE